MKKSLFFATALLTLAACTREKNVDFPTGDVTITAKTEISADTRTVVESETHVYWEPGDEIKVFAGGKSGKFTTDITASAASATFNGTLGDDAWTEGMDLWAVYPYSADAVFSDGTITTVLPSEQVARTGSFGKDMNLAVAHSTTPNLQFYNVGGGVRFSLSQDGITEVVLEGLTGETLAGKIKVGFKDGKPVIQEVTEKKMSITITPSEGGAFKKNDWYYIVTIPGTLESGFKMSFRKDYALDSREFDRSISIKRGIFGTLTHADKEPGAPYSTPDAVDLGLSVKWASFNLGATAPEDAGNFYAWGEILPKDKYDWSTYKWCNGLSTSYTKYCTDSSYGFDGFTDGKTILDPEDDAAHVAFGDNWRMPTYKEASELITKCNWSWTTINGVNGYKVKGKNGYFIFLPAEGYMQGSSLSARGTNSGFWLSELYQNGTTQPLHLWTASSSSTNKLMIGTRSRGLFIRPVYEIPVEGISFDKNELIIEEGKAGQIDATITPQDASYQNLIWQSSNPLVATVKGYTPIEGWNHQVGAVTALAIGSATITATSKDGNIKASCHVVVNPRTPSITVNMHEPDGQVFNAEQKNVRFDFALDDGSTWERATVSYGGTILQSFEENNSATFVHQIDAIQNGMKKYTITVLLKHGKTIEKNIYVVVSVRGKKDFFWGTYEKYTEGVWGDITIPTCSAVELVSEYLGGVFFLDSIPSYPDMLEFSTTYRYGTMWFMYPTEWDSDSISIIGDGNLEYNTDFVRMANDNTYLNGISYTIRYLPHPAGVHDFPWKIYLH